MAEAARSAEAAKEAAVAATVEAMASAVVEAGLEAKTAEREAVASAVAAERAAGAKAMAEAARSAEAAKEAAVAAAVEMEGCECAAARVVAVAVAVAAAEVEAQATQEAVLMKALNEAAVEARSARIVTQVKAWDARVAAGLKIKKQHDDALHKACSDAPHQASTTPNKASVPIELSSIEGNRCSREPLWELPPTRCRAAGHSRARRNAQSPLLMQSPLASCFVSPLSTTNSEPAPLQVDLQVDTVDTLCSASTPSGVSPRSTLDIDSTFGAVTSSSASESPSSSASAVSRRSSQASPFHRRTWRTELTPSVRVRPAAASGPSDRTPHSDGARSLAAKPEGMGFSDASSELRTPDVADVAGDSATPEWLGAAAMHLDASALRAIDEETAARARESQAREADGDEEVPPCHSKWCHS